ncbi:MAG: hypothetical protein CMN31_13210, partial [Sandaracinus sp.]|nr:hypothetical protein [Sandaracinus sp.]
MDERRHSAFTGKRATVDQWVGGRLTAGDGYIDATHILLDTGRRIVLTWRTADFPVDAPDSQVEVLLEPVAGGTKVTIEQSAIPAGQAEKYKKTWRKLYLNSMRRFFSSRENARKALRSAAKKGLLPTPGPRRGRRPIVGPRPGHGSGPAPEADAKKDVKKAAEGKKGKKKSAKKKAAKKKAAKPKSAKKAAPKKTAKKRSSKKAAKKAAPKKTAKKRSSKKAAKKAAPKKTAKKRS